MDVRVGLWRRLSTKELMLLNCGVFGEDCWESLGPVHSEDQPWDFFGRNDGKLKLQYFGHLMWRVDSLEKTLMLGGMGARGEGDDRGWDGWMASLTWWMWVWVNSRSWQWTGRPGVLWFMGSQRTGHNWATDLIWQYRWPGFDPWVGQIPWRREWLPTPDSGLENSMVCSIVHGVAKSRTQLINFYFTRTSHNRINYIL